MLVATKFLLLRLNTLLYNEWALSEASFVNILRHFVQNLARRRPVHPMELIVVLKRPVRVVDTVSGDSALKLQKATGQKLPLPPFFAGAPHTQKFKNWEKLPFRPL